MQDHILITGSEGLIGTALASALSRSGASIGRFDRKLSFGGSRLDVLDAAQLGRAVAGCIGIVHLAAVSRVVHGERDPAACWRTNVDGTRNVLAAAYKARRRPWVLMASSREVYGQPAALPASEDAPLSPLNVYGRSKVEAEQLCLSARAEGLQTAVMRLSNVYGSTDDHADRVVPCFAARAVRGQPLRVDGRHHTFDFTHLEDTVAGIQQLIALLLEGEQALPPIHFVTGQPTTLERLARWAIQAAGRRSVIVDAAPRSYDVARFYGDPRRAEELLGWRAKIPLREGLGRLVSEFARHELARKAVAHSLSQDEHSPHESE